MSSLGASLVRSVGVPGLLIGPLGLYSTCFTLVKLHRHGGLATIVSLNDSVVPAFLIIATEVLDVLAYPALFVVSVALVLAKHSFRRAGLVLGCYFAFMSVAQPLVQYFAIHLPLVAARVRAPDSAQVEAMIGGSMLSFVYALALCTALYYWRGEDRYPLATDAPREWPTVYSERGPLSHLQLMVALSLASELQPRRPGSRVVLLRHRLYDDGLLRGPLVFEQQGQHTAIFVYEDGSARSAAHYAGASTLVREREGMESVYFAPARIHAAAPAAVLELLDPSHFSKPQRERPPAEYALWWPTPEEPRLRDSAALAHLDAWFEAVQRAGSVLFASFARFLGLKGAESGRLPQAPLIVPVDGPQDLVLYLHASADEGLWFSFDVEKTDAALRNRLLAHLARLAGNADRAAAVGWLPQPAGVNGALPFWRRERERALGLEGGGSTDVRVGASREGAQREGGTK